MSVRKHKTKPSVWIIDFYDTDKKRHQVEFPGDRIDALEAEKQLRRHRAHTRTNPSISAVWEEYLEWCQLHLSPLTVRNKLQMWDRAKGIFGRLPVNHLTRQHFNQYQAERIKIVSPASVNKEVGYLLGVIKWMADMDYCHALPFRPKALKVSRPLPQIPTSEQIATFLGHYYGEKRELVLMMLCCGLRSAEARLLRWEDINFEAGTVTILGKGSRYRTLPVPSFLLAELAKRKFKEGHIWRNPQTGEPYQHLAWSFRTASAKAGIKITPHGLRHAFATLTLESERDVRLVQALLGHSKVETTKIYTAISMARMRDGMRWQEGIASK